MLTQTVRSVSIAVLLATSSVTSSPVHTRTPYLVKDTHNVPNRWSNLGRAPPGTILNLNIGLKQSRFDELERHLYEGMLIVDSIFQELYIMHRT